MLFLKMTGLSSKTVRFYIQKAEESIAGDLEDEDEFIGREDSEVKIDKSKFGKRKNSRGNNFEKVWVAGGCVELQKQRN